MCAIKRHIKHVGISLVIPLSQRKSYLYFTSSYPRNKLTDNITELDRGFWRSLTEFFRLLGYYVA
jgi:hypothetical protein